MGWIDEWVVYPQVAVINHSLIQAQPATYHPATTLLSAISIQGGHSHFLDGATATANDANASDADADWADASTSTLQRAANLLDLLFPLSSGLRLCQRCHIRNVKA